MKTYIKLPIILLLVLSILSCEREMMSYTGNEGIYFSVRRNSIGQVTDVGYNLKHYSYTDIDFIKLGSKQEEIQLRVSISGEVKNYDRVFNLRILQDSTTAISGIHFEPLQDKWIIPANKSFVNIKLHIFRTPDLDTSTKILSLQLVPTKDFDLTFPTWTTTESKVEHPTPGYFNANVHHVYITNQMLEPPMWATYGIVINNKEMDGFGKFSRKKLEFLTNHFNIQYTDFVPPAYFGVNKMLYFTNETSRILIEKFESGEPILEDDGRLMWVRGVPWESIVGQPWR